MDKKPIKTDKKTSKAPAKMDKNSSKAPAKTDKNSSKLPSTPEHLTPTKKAYFGLVKEMVQDEYDDHKNAFDDFFSNIEEQKQEVAREFDDEEAELEKQEDALDKACADALAMDPPNPVTGKVHKEDTPLFKACQDVVDTTNKLVDRFNELDQELKTNVWEHPVEKWQKDKNDIVEIMAAGRKHGEKLVENALADKPKSMPLADPKATTHEKAARDMLYPKRKNPYDDFWDDAWGPAADKARKRFKQRLDNEPVSSSDDDYEW